MRTLQSRTMAVLSKRCATRNFEQTGSAHSLVGRTNRLHKGMWQDALLFSLVAEELVCRSSAVRGLCSAPSIESRSPLLNRGQCATWVRLRLSVLECPAARGRNTGKCEVGSPCRLLNQLRRSMRKSLTSFLTNRMKRASTCFVCGNLFLILPRGNHTLVLSLNRLNGDKPRTVRSRKLVAHCGSHRLVRGKRMTTSCWLSAKRPSLRTSTPFFLGYLIPKATESSAFVTTSPGMRMNYLCASNMPRPCIPSAPEPAVDESAAVFGPTALAWWPESPTRRLVAV